MVTYKEQLKKKKYYVIIKDNVCLGVFSTIKKLCKEISEIDEKFPSYWTVSRLDRSEPVKVKEYIIQELHINNGRI